jgi:hypothetical protein
MDYINYTPVNTDPAKFEAPVGATSATPKTLYHAHTDITYVSTGGPWTPLCQASSGSVYSGYTSLSPAAKATVVNNLSATPVQLGKSLQTATVLVRGR